MADWLLVDGVRVRLINEIYLHITAWPGDPDIEEIRRDHIENRGFADVGYHWLIRQDGTIQKGRPETLAGAHAQGYNKHSLGIAFNGVAGQFTVAQLRAAVSLVKAKRREFKVEMDNIKGHYQVSEKSCPCFEIADFRALVRGE